MYCTASFFSFHTIAVAGAPDEGVPRLLQLGLPQQEGPSGGDQVKKPFIQIYFGRKLIFLWGFRCEEPDFVEFCYCCPGNLMFPIFFPYGKP